MEEMANEIKGKIRDVLQANKKGGEAKGEKLKRDARFADNSKDRSVFISRVEDARTIYFA